MAVEVRSQADALMQKLADDPHHFDFFQLVRRLDCAFPDLPPTGHSSLPKDDPVRFGQEPSMRFAPSAISGFHPGATQDNPGLPRINLDCFGLLGPNGPMPLHFTQYVRDRIFNNHDKTLSRFLDVFHHRAASLFYRAWSTHQQTVQFERGGDDRFAMYIASLFGMGMDSLRGRDSVADKAKLYYSGRLVNQTRHAEGLAGILDGYFQVKTRITQFVGQWIELPDDCKCRVGESKRTGLMGMTTIVGSMVWDTQQKFRIHMGPMDRADYERLLPSGSSFKRLTTWVRIYTCDELSWDVQLILKKDHVPDTKLGMAGRLGWTTWLKSGSAPFDRDADDLVLQPSEFEHGTE